MRVVNCHKRIISQPKEKVSVLFETLATTKDQIWPIGKWPAMRFNDDLKLGSRGGHGQIRYTIIGLQRGEYIKFKFTKPEGFVGVHELYVEALSENTSEIRHIIKMNTTFKASLLWLFIIRWLHNALIEDAFDNVEHYFSKAIKKSSYNFWVIILRDFYKRKSYQTKQV